MAEFFSLGGGGGREATSSQEYHHHHQETTNSTHNWFLYKHHDQELPTYKGFELWQQQQPHHNDEEQNYQILRNPIINPFGLDIGPSNDHHHHHHETNMMMRSSTITISCQDCGNQAKKDCQHMRCRTCCKSRGFQCQTHVKSTWVPAAKRRERQQQLASLQPQQQEEDNNKSKRQKDDSNAGLEIANNFPSKVNSTAVFQRVRMSSIEENEDQIAYQAAVNINGHIFKGILYDQGDNHEYNYMNGGDHDSSSGVDPVPHQHNLNITGTATSAVNDVTVGGGGGASAVAAEGSSHFLETSLYSSVNTFVAGTQFFPPSRS